MSKKLLIPFFLLGITIILLKLDLRRSPPPTVFNPFLTPDEPQVVRISPITLRGIFSQERPKVATFSAGKLITLITTGDVGLVRDVNFQMVKRNDFVYPFEKTAEVLKKADLTLVNLEDPLVESCLLTTEGMVFCGDPRGVEGLVSAGVDLVNLANNHSFDYGKKGLTETTEVLTAGGITPSEPEKIVAKGIKGQKLAFLGYEDVDKKVNKGQIETQIKEVSSLADVVIISFHWGTEYTAYPTQRQRDLAHLAIESGADLVIGHHPHWIQPIEIYKEKLIVYSHGNFVFDQLWSKETRKGIIGKYTFYEDKLIDAQFLPIFINDAYQPYLLEGEEKEEILKAMEQASWKLQP